MTKLSGLARLSASASRLNAAANEFETAIEVTEDLIAKNNVGLTVWLDSAKHAFCVVFAGPPDECEEAEAMTLGYCRIAGNWRIAVKRVVMERDSPNLEDHQDGEPFPLLQAARHVRIEAADHLDALFDALAQQADSLVAKYEAAKLKVTAITRLSLGDLRESPPPLATSPMFPLGDPLASNNAHAKGAAGVTDPKHPLTAEQADAVFRQFVVLKKGGK